MGDGSTREQLLAYVQHLEERMLHATEFRYGCMVARLEGRRWHVRSDDRSTHIILEGADAMDDAIREACRRSKSAPTGAGEGSK